MPRRNRRRSYGNEGCLGFNPRKYISGTGGEGEPDRAGGGSTGGGGSAGSSSKRDYSRQMQLVSTGSRHACTHRKTHSNNSRKGRAMRQIRRMQESAELVRITTGTEASCCRAAPESPAASETTTEAISPSVVLSDEMSAQRDAHDDGNKGIADAADNCSAYAVYSANRAASDSQLTQPTTPSYSTAKTNLFQGVKTWLKTKIIRKSR